MNHCLNVFPSFLFYIFILLLLVKFFFLHQPPSSQHLRRSLKFTGKCNQREITSGQLQD